MDTSAEQQGASHKDRIKGYLAEKLPRPKGKLLSTMAALALLPCFIGGCVNTDSDESKIPNYVQSGVIREPGILNAISSRLLENKLEKGVWLALFSDEFNLGDEVIVDVYGREDQKRVDLDAKKSQGVVFDLENTAVGIYNLSSDEVSIDPTQIKSWLDTFKADAKYDDRPYIVALTDDVPLLIENDESKRLSDESLPPCSSIIVPHSVIVINIAVGELQRQIERAIVNGNLQSRLQTELESQRESNEHGITFLVDPKSGKPREYYIPRFFNDIPESEQMKVAGLFDAAFRGEQPLLTTPNWGGVEITGERNADINRAMAYCFAGEMRLATNVISCGLSKDDNETAWDAFDWNTWRENREIYERQAKGLQSPFIISNK